jgi:hypothetical protein
VPRSIVFRPRGRYEDGLGASLSPGGGVEPPGSDGDGEDGEGDGSVGVGWGSLGVGDGSEGGGVGPGPDGVGRPGVGSGPELPGADGPAVPYPPIVTTAPAGAIDTRAPQGPTGSRR